MKCPKCNKHRLRMLKVERGKIRKRCPGCGEIVYTRKNYEVHKAKVR